MSPTSLQNVLATSAYVIFYEITKQSRDELLARKVTPVHLWREKLLIHFSIAYPNTHGSELWETSWTGSAVRAKSNNCLKCKILGIFFIFYPLNLDPQYNFIV